MAKVTVKFPGTPSPEQVEQAFALLMEKDNVTRTQLEDIHTPAHHLISKIRHGKCVPVKTTLREHETVLKKTEDEIVLAKEFGVTVYSILPEEKARYRDDREGQKQGVAAVKAFNGYHQACKRLVKHASICNGAGHIVAPTAAQVAFARVRIKTVMQGSSTLGIVPETAAANDDEYEVRA